MNKILLTSICSLTISVPSGFLIYYVSSSSEPTPQEKEKAKKIEIVERNEKQLLSKKSKVEGTSRYLFGQITSETSKKVATYTGPLTFTCAMSNGQKCDVKVLNREELIKQNTLDFNTINDLFVDATKEQLIKGTYVQVSLSNEDELKNKTETETITIAGTDITFTIRMENWEGNSFKSIQEEFVTKTITKTQEVDDVDNTKYCLIKLLNETKIYDNRGWLFPRNKENSSNFLWMINDGVDIYPLQKAELYEIADQSQIKSNVTQQNKAYFDTQKKFIQTIEQLKQQKEKWVKMVIQDKKVGCQISMIQFQKDKDSILEYFENDDTPAENYELKEKTSKQ